MYLPAWFTFHARALPPELPFPTPLPYRYRASADGPALLLLHMWQGGGRKTSSLPYVTGPRSSWEHLAGTPILRWPGDDPGIGDVSLTITSFHHRRASPPSPPSTCPPPRALPPLSFLLHPPTLPVNLSGGPMPWHCPHRAGPTPVRRTARSAILTPTRAIEARTGLSIAPIAARRAGYGLAVVARAGGGGRPRAPWRGYQGGGRGEEEGGGR